MRTSSPPNADVPLRTLPFGALRASLVGYTKADLRADLLAGLIVGVVALPLSMALSIGVGTPPQQGLYTAIVAGFVVAAIGGSRVQVTGPTFVFFLLISEIYTKQGLSGLLMAGVLAGLILILLGALRLGRLIEFIPSPVTTGFTAGIGTVIATMELKDLLGLEIPHMPDRFQERIAAMFAARSSASLTELGLGLFTLALLVGLPRLTTRVPAPLLALPAAAVAAAALTHFAPALHAATLATRFHTTIGGHVFDGVPRLPPLPMWPWHAGGGGPPFALNLTALQELMPSAFAIAMLGAIESLLSAVVSDGMARTRHDPDAELLALGVGNVLAPFFGGIPATGAIARTATNVRSGGRTPIAAMTHAVTVLAAVLVLAPLLGYLPMASLAALLMLVAWNMSDAEHFVHIVKVAPKSDVTVLLVCYGLTVAFDMVVAVSVGVMLASLLFMRRMAEVTKVTTSGTGQHALLPGPVPPGVMVYDIDGPLFFGAAQKAMATLSHVTDRSKVVILRLDDVPMMDATGLIALESALDQLRGRGCLALLTGLQTQPAKVLLRGHVDRREGVVICASLAEALERAGAAAAA